MLFSFDDQTMKAGWPKANTGNGADELFWSLALIVNCNRLAFISDIATRFQLENAANNNSKYPARIYNMRLTVQRCIHDSGQ